MAGAVAGAVVATGGLAAGAAGMAASAGGMTAAAGSVAAAGTAAKVAAGAAGAATAAYVGNKMMNSNEEAKLYKEIANRPEQPLQLQSAQLSEPGYTLIVLFLRNFILNAHRGLDASTDAGTGLAAQKKFKRCSPSRRATTAAKLLPQRGSLRRRTSGCAQKSRCTWSGGRWRTSSCIQRRGLKFPGILAASQPVTGNFDLEGAALDQPEGARATICKRVPNWVQRLLRQQLHPDRWTHVYRICRRRRQTGPKRKEL